jgi:citrate lyase subunit beta/citryl-CoA lyase
MHGKVAVSESQVTAINAVFSPTADEIAYARRLVEAHAAAGEDAVAHIDGRIIDAPAVRRARRLVELATAIEAKEQQAAI